MNKKEKERKREVSSPLNVFCSLKSSEDAPFEWSLFELRDNRVNNIFIRILFLMKEEKLRIFIVMILLINKLWNFIHLKKKKETFCRLLSFIGALFTFAVIYYNKLSPPCDRPRNKYILDSELR